MKTFLVPLFLGALGLALITAEPARAQSGFNSSRPPTADRAFPGAFSQPQPQQNAPVATAVPGNGMPGYAGYNAAAMGMSAAPIDPNHKLGRGDVLTYYVREDREDPSKIPPVIVTDSGEVELPPLGRVRAAGKTVSQLTAEVKSQLEQKYYWPGHATVVLGLNSEAVRSSRGRVYIVGPVKSEGAVDLPVDGELTVSNAIAKCSGFKDFASKKVRVFRKGGPADGIEVDVGRVNKGRLDEDVVLQPDDRIVVKEKIFNL